MNNLPPDSGSFSKAGGRKPAELILNADGSIYHLGLRPEHIPPTILTVGDPERVSHVSKYFDRVTFRQQRREFVAHGGELGKQSLLVISSGMGTDNVEILLTELDALVNLDLVTGEEKPHQTALRIVRLGTSGSLQADIPVGSLLVSEGAVGLDSLMAFYQLPQTAEEQLLSAALQQSLPLPFLPYCVAGSAALQGQLAADSIPGLTLTCPGFYGPQGRRLRLDPGISGLVARLEAFRAGTRRFTNFEMETAGYYALGRLLGHETLSLNAILANRITGEFAAQPEQTVDQLIRSVLERL